MTDRKVVLITGGVRGLGRAIGTELASRGWAVAATYRTSEADAEALRNELERGASPSIVESVDVSDAPKAAGFVRRVSDEWGRIDALINCAGPYHRVYLLDETVEGWNEMFDNNLHPVFYLARAVAPLMKTRKWGRIVNFSMANADQHVGQPYVTAHYIAKAGILILTRTLAKVLAPHGITVNAISPGFIETGSATLDDLSRAVNGIPAGYVGVPRDAVAAVTFLLSDEARYVNGTNIHVSGAWGV